MHPDDPIYDDAYIRGVAFGFPEGDSRRASLMRIADRLESYSKLRYRFWVGDGEAAMQPDVAGPWAWFGDPSKAPKGL